MTEKETLMEFPCDFQIKVIGKNSGVFLNDIKRITEVYFPTVTDSDFQKKPSAEGNFLAISVHIYVQNQATLDALYRDLTNHPDVKMVL